jgi:hypothetical protein
MSGGTRRFDVVPGVALEISGDEGVQRHFAAEYGAGSTPQPGEETAHLRIVFGRDLAHAAGHDDGSVLSGSHKTVAWRVAVSAPDAERLTATISLRGVPRWFGLSLVQGYVVEPLLSVAAAAAGAVLLPAAGIVVRSGAIVLVGRSRAGKSSVTARAAAAGHGVLGDDQVIVVPGGTIRRFPRRLRFYDDLATTAPDAYRRLPARVRRALLIRRLARIASRGFIRPSLAVPATALGAAEVNDAPLTRFVVLERTADSPRFEVESIGSEEAIAAAMAVLEDQRRHLRHLGGGWSEHLTELARRERAVLTSALSTIPAERIRLPKTGDAAASVGAIWDHLRA